MNTSFLEELIQEDVVKKDHAQELLRLADEKYEGNLEKALIASGIDESELLERKGKFYGIPTRRVDAGAIPVSVLQYIPEESAKIYHLVPIGMEDKVLLVGLLDPEDIGALDAIQFITSKLNIPFKIFLITQGDFDKIIDTYKGVSSEVDKAVADLGSEISELDASGVEAINPTRELNSKEEEKIVEEAPIVKIVDAIIKYAAEGDASDIHIENIGDKVQVRYRVDGELHTSLTLPIASYAGVVARIKLKAQLRLDEKRKPQDGGYAVLVDGRKIDLRVSTLPSVYGEKVEIRILDSQKGVKKLSELGFSKENSALIQEAIHRPYGLILITGPTGSGKTTTLYSMLNELDRVKANVVSLEDPVEYRIPNMIQSQVAPDIGYTFATGLRSILRQDPDIIMVGEIRDKETAQLAIQAALTGHLVLSTLHTNSAIGAIPRLIDMGVDPYLIAPTLILSMAQRLARVICPSSRKKVPMSESVKDIIDKQFADLPQEFRSKLPIGADMTSMYDVVESPECKTGTKGRMAVFEMFKIDQEMQKIILNNPTELDLNKALRARGMLSMREDAILKSLQGLVPFQEVFAEL